MKRPGRPTSLTPLVLTEIVCCLKIGMSVAATLQALGIPERTFYDWRKRYPDFRSYLQQSRQKDKFFDPEDDRIRKALVVEAIHRGCCTKADLQRDTGFSEWIVRQTLETLVAEKRLVQRRQSAPSAKNPYLYFLV